MPELNIIGAKEENRYFPYQRAFRVTRQSFYQAGQDSFTSPSAQNPDMFAALTNIEPVTSGNLQRRRGYTLLASTAPSAPFHEGYAFRSETLNLRRLVWTSSSTVVALDESGNTISSPLFTPALNADSVRMVLSRSYGYFADGVQADYQKWDGTTNTGNLTNWGIAVQANPGSINGPNNAGTFANVNFAGGGTAWSPGTSLPSTVTLPAFTDSKYLQATNYSFSVSPTSAVVTGIVVNITGSQTNNTQSSTALQLVKGGVIGGTLHSIPLPTSSGTVTYGSPTDTWGLSLIGSDVNASNFGVAIACGTTVGTVVSISAVNITVYVSGGTITLGSPTGTGITLLNGRVYTVVFQNSTTGTTSSLYPFSSSTGPLTNQGQPISGLPVSSDPQVDTKLLIATADGGDETSLYLVASIPNATTTYTDTMPDATLLTQPVYQQTDINGNLHGVANNNPPPTIKFPTAHLGRIYGLIGPTLYFSKNLDDVTTSTGTITTKWEEAWPATYLLDISAQAETGTGILSDGQTLWLGTDTCIRRLIGDSPSNFQQPQITFNETGVQNQEVWKIVFAEGQPVGSMWLTPDQRVMFSDFNTYTDVGSPIQDILNSINKNVASSVSHACFVSRGPSEYYMLYLPTGSSTVANTVCVYNMRAKKWAIWNPTDTVTSSTFNISANGTPQWLFATQAGPIYQWDPSVRQDRNGNTPVSYTASVTTSWLDFGDTGLTKAFNKILVTTGDDVLTVGVTGAIRDADFSSPAVVLPATAVQAEIFGDLFIPMVGQPGFYKWYQVTFTSPASTVLDVLDAFDFEIAPSMRM